MTSGQPLSRFNCNFCGYNLSVTEALHPWAAEVMLSHAKKKHPAELEKAFNNETSVPS